MRIGSGGADLGQEFVDRATQHAGLIVEFTGVRQHVRGRRAGGRRRRGDAADVGADLVRSGRDRLDVARDLAGRIALLFDRRGNADGDLAHLGDGFGDAADRGDRVAGGGLHRRDLRGDFLGSLGGLVGERLDLGGNDGKAAAGFAGARRFDGGVQREQIGLRGNAVDQLDNFADLLGAGRQRADGGIGALGIAYRLAGDLARSLHLAGNLGDRARQLFGCRRDRSDVVRGALRGGPDRGGARAGVARGGRHGLRGGLHSRRRGRHRTDDAVDAAFEVAGKTLHGRATLGRATRLRLRLDLFEPAYPQRIVLEYLNRRRHRADLIAAPGAGNVPVQRAIGQRPHP